MEYNFQMLSMETELVENSMEEVNIIWVRG